MASKNGSKELISLLQYMKDTRLDNPEIKVKDERLIELDRIVSEVKESEEWEAVEIVLITVVLIGLVIIFKSQITSLVNKLLSKMTSQANKI